MATDRPHLRVFISSPGDVRPERLIADRVVARLDREFSYHARLEAVFWEREPLVATAHFQEGIVPPRDTDIVVVILWSRLGTVLPPEKFIGAVSGAAVTGTEWEFEDAVDGHRKSGRPDLLVYRKSARVTVDLDDETGLEASRDQRRRVGAFVRDWFEGDGGTTKAAFHEFADAASFEELLYTHLRALVRQRLDPGAETGSPPSIRWHQGSPFRGLESFDLEHAPVFFGRTRARNELREALAARAAAGTGFVLVLGASGSGKSSLVKAGLLPDLKLPGMLDRVGLVRHAVLRIGDAGGDPVGGLAQAMLSPTALPELAAQRYDPARLTALLTQAPGALAAPLEAALAEAGRAADLAAHAEARLCLIVDQLEELFTLEGAGGDREAFVAALAGLAATGSCLVVATLRSDFFGRLEEIPELVALSQGEGRYYLTLPGQSERGQIVRGPALEAGLTFEINETSGEGLDERILIDTGNQADALPLLEFLLDQLWQQRSATGLLTFAAYERLGGLAGAIGSRAEQVYQTQPGDVQAALPDLARQLVTVSAADAETAPTARPVRLAYYDEAGAARRLIDALAAPEARLLVLDREGAEATIRLAHEALLTHWPRLAGLIAADRGFLSLRHRMEAAAAQWRDEAEPKERLLTGKMDLAEAETLLDRRADIDRNAAAFLERSLGASRAAARRRGRLRTGVTASFAVLAVAAVAAALWATQQQRLAAEQARVAEGRFELARGVAGDIVLGLADGLKDAGLTVAARRQVLGRAEEIYEQLIDQVPDDTALLHDRVWLLLVQAEALIAEGLTDEAHADAGEALAIAERLARLDPDNSEWQRDLMVSHNWVGNVRRIRGDPSAALTSFEAALAIAERLARLDPDNTEWQRDLSVSHEKIGDIHDAQGNRAGGLASHEAGQIIRRRLTELDPDNTEWQRGLSISHERIGDGRLSQGDLAGALASHEAGLAISERLAALDPSNTEWQRDLAIRHGKVGDVRDMQGDPAGALAAYEAGLAIAARLTDLDPGNTEWQRDLSVIHNKIGGVRLSQDDPAGALVSYEAALAIAERLTERDPDNVEWRRDLSISLARIGDVYLAQGEFAGALAAYEADLAIMERLTELDPSHIEWQRDLSVSHNLIGDVHDDRGDPDRALASYEASLAISRRLVDLDPDNSEFQRDLFVSHGRMGWVLVALGDAAAHRHAELALRLAEERAARWPDLPQARSDLSFAQMLAAEVAAAFDETQGQVAE